MDFTLESKITDDVQLVRQLAARWTDCREWAVQLLVSVFGFNEAQDVLQPGNRGYHSIPGTGWFYRTHGYGVDISKPGNKGGIDFDFGLTEPDEWRLRSFLVKQYNAGGLRKSDFRPLLEDEERWKQAVTVWERSTAEDG